MNLFFIVNPIAGKGSSLKVIPKIENYCKRQKINFQIKKTQYAGHATKLAREASNLGYDSIIAVGGDGTLLEVANGLLGSSVPLGIIPSGTGNDFARTIGIPENVEKALDCITENQSTRIDVGKIGDVCFINVASVGFDAEIARDVIKLQKYMPGKISYYIAALLKVFTYRFKNVQIEIDGEKMNFKILLIAIANGCYYGGGMKVNPNGHIEDGYLDIIVITALPRFKIPLLFSKFIKGDYLKLPYVKIYKARKVKIHSEKTLPVNTDGDIKAQTPSEFSISPLALNVIKNPSF